MINVSELAARLSKAVADRTAIGKLSDEFPELDIPTAYQVQRYFVDNLEMLYLVTFCLPRFLWLLTSSALGDALRRLDPSPVLGLGAQAQEARGGLQVWTQPLIHLAKNGLQHIAVSRGQRR